MIILSGGTGTPKMIEGLLMLINEKELKIIVNTADDISIFNNYISPDIDTILYLLLKIIDKEKWWGIENDTFNTYNQFQYFGINELLKIGD